MGISRILDRLTVLSAALWAAPLPAATAGFDVFVVDADAQTPISDVEVAGWFANGNGWKAWTESAPVYEDRKLTDAAGVCHLEGETNNGRTGVAIDKTPKGYYRYPGTSHVFTQKPLLPLAHWRPTGLVITAALCRVEHPVPLFVKHVFFLPGREAMAENGERVLYDLVKGDCLPPFGDGEVPDVEFTILPQEEMPNGKNVFYEKARNRNLVRMSFVGDDGNGQVCAMPRHDAYLRIRVAPENGYKRDFTFSEWYASDLDRKEGRDPERCFSFRIRVKRNKAGEIVSALHGKMYGDLRFLYRGDDYAPDRWSRKIDGMAFCYYLNPTSNDRNLEWDMKNNLCKKPGNLEFIVNGNPVLLP